MPAVASPDLTALQAQLNVTPSRDAAVASFAAVADAWAAAFAGWQNAVADYAAALRDANGQIAQLEADCAAAVAMIETKAQHATGLEAQLTDAQTALAAARTQAAALTTRVAALTAQVAELTPPTGSVIPVSTFRGRIARAYLVLAAADDATQKKWDRIVGAFLADGTVDLSSPATKALVAEAVADGLLKESEAAAALAFA